MGPFFLQSARNRAREWLPVGIAVVRADGNRRIGPQDAARDRRHLRTRADTWRHASWATSSDIHDRRRGSSTGGRQTPEIEEPRAPAEKKIGCKCIQFVGMSRTTAEAAFCQPRQFVASQDVRASRRFRNDPGLSTAECLKGPQPSHCREGNAAQRSNGRFRETAPRRRSM